jgi:hypothetical protein
MPDEQIDVSEYVELERAALKRFETWWLRMQRDTPDSFPARMNMAEWWEQTAVWNEDNA